MNELERKALDEVLRTVRLINQKVAEVNELPHPPYFAQSPVLGITDGAVPVRFYGALFFQNPAIPFFLFVTAPPSCFRPDHNRAAVVTA